MHIPFSLLETLGVLGDFSEEAVFGFDLGAGRSGVEPHAFIGASGGADAQRGEGDEERTEFHRVKAKAKTAARGEPEGARLRKGVRV